MTTKKPPSVEQPREWLIALTDHELEAIYNAIEQLLPDPDHEAALASVIDKITPNRVGNPAPAGHVPRGPEAAP